MKKSEKIKQMALRTTNERVFTWKVKQISETKAKQTKLFTSREKKSKAKKKKNWQNMSQLQSYSNQINTGLNINKIRI